MNVRSLRLGVLAVLVVLVASSGAFATSIPVANYSFETYTSLPFLCGGACAYSIGPIPGWNDNGTSGQWITGGYAGNPSAIAGSVLGYSNGGQIWQDVGVAVAGATYTLQVEILHRTDVPMAGIVQFEIGGSPVVTATGTDLGAGTWSNWTAVYTATASDAGKTLTVLLDSSGAQGDFDDVRLDASVPEPSSLLLLGSGLIGVAAVVRRKIKSSFAVLNLSASKPGICSPAYF